MIAALLGVIVVLSGCPVSSMNPLYEDEFLSKPDPDLVVDQAFVGHWRIQDKECPKILTITNKESVYHLTAAPSPQCKSEEKTYRYEGHLVKLDGHIFLDLGPEPDEVCEMCFPQHHIFLARIEKSSFSLTPLDDEWLKTSIAQKIVVIQTLPARPEVVTAPSKELKEFVRKYADDQSAFKPVPELTCERQ